MNRLFSFYRYTAVPMAIIGGVSSAALVNLNDGYLEDYYFGLALGLTAGGFYPITGSLLVMGYAGNIISNIIRG